MGLDFDFSRLDAQDILDLAVFVEEEARDHYEQLETWMRQGGSDEAAKFFGKMVVLEANHLKVVTDKRKALFGDAPPRHTSNIAWEVEAPDYDSIGASLTLEQAFEIARGAEQRAHDYYAGAIDFATDPQVADLLEELRKAELEHLRLLDDWQSRLRP